MWTAALSEVRPPSAVRPPICVPEVTPDNILVFTLMDEPTEERLEFDIDKSNDWSETDNTMGSNYIWEPMK